MRQLSGEHKGVVLTVLATFCWGGGMVLSKQSLGSVDANNLFVVQLISAWVCVLLATLIGSKLSTREWKHGWLGIMEPGIAFYLVLNGLARTSAINATILQAMEGLMIIALSFALFRGKVASSTLVWGCLSAIGAVLVTTKDSILSGITINSGDWLVLLGTLAAAAYVTLSSRVVGGGNRAESLLFWQLSYCTVLVVVCLLMFGDLSLQIGQFSIYAVLSGALTYGLSFYFYLCGMKYIPTSLSAILLCLTPIFGVSLSVIFLSESLSAQNIVGFVLILASSAFVTRQSATPAY